MVALLLGCGPQPRVAYQPGDATGTAEPRRWSFDGEAPGRLPTGASVFTGAWAVRAAPDAPSPPNALCQTATTEFPALALADDVYADAVVSTRFKPISGRTDQAAGIIFRVQDRDNYYILRANALENNVVFFKYAGGRRSQMREASATVPSGRWQALRVEAVGSRLRGYLNDQLVVETTDDTYRAGKVGLWTKADSQTCFDDVEARAP